MGAIGTVSLGEEAASIEHRHKKKRYAYLAWLCLGSHYLYLGRPFRQLFFWLTLGGLLLWWLSDFFRLPDMIAEHNERADNLAAGYEASAVPITTLPLEIRPPLYQFQPPASAFDGDAPAKANRRIVPALVLTSALGVAAALYIFNPPSLFPRSDASFRAVRQVNVRDLPSTGSPIRAVAARETVLSGTIVKASGGTTRWLRIGRGSHSGGYVAVQNLESL